MRAHERLEIIGTDGILLIVAVGSVSAFDLLVLLPFASVRLAEREC